MKIITDHFGDVKVLENDVFVKIILRAVDYVVKLHFSAQKKVNLSCNKTLKILISGLAIFYLL